MRTETLELLYDLRSFLSAQLDAVPDDNEAADLIGRVQIEIEKEEGR